MFSHETDQQGRAAISAKYTHEFKLAAIERTKIVGMSQTAEEMKIDMSTLKGWIQLTVHPHNCDYCDKAFPFKAQLKKHLLTHPQYKEQNGLQEEAKQSNLRYEESFKKEVALFAIQHSIQDATAKYSLPHSTVNYWVKLMNDPRACHLCGKEFANDSTVRRHIEQVHRNTPEGVIEQARKIQEQQKDQTFSMFLAENDMLPSEEEIKAREEEKERKEQEKQELASVAKEIFEKEKQKWKLEQLQKEEERLKSKVVNDMENFNSTTIEEENDSKNLVQIRFNNDSNSNSPHQNEEDDKFEVDDDFPQQEEDNDEFKDIAVKSEAESDAGDENLEPNIFEPNTCLETEGVAPNNMETENDVIDDKSCVQRIINLDELKKIKEEPEPLNDNYNKPRKKVKKISSCDKDKANKACCSFCQKIFSSPARAVYHEKVVHLGKFVTHCEFCGTQFKEGIKLQEHQNRMHWKELEDKSGVPVTKYPCSLCGRVFYVKRDYDRHLQLSHGPKKPTEFKHLCTECGKKFSRLVYLKSHRAKIHGIGQLKLRNFLCPHCENVYHFKDHLNRHIRVVHDNIRVQCDFCAKLFSDRSALNRHLLYHGEPKFQCDECPEKFREGMHLKRHKRVHAGQILSENTCEICSKSFSSYQSLRNHQLMYHENSEENAVCTECGREYKTQKLLKAHMRIHTKTYMDKKYTCDICGNEYKSNVSLQNHVNTIHMGQRNFPCDVCGKLFSRANTLRTHKKIHDGFKQFHCLYCNAAYGEKRNLMNHIARNHPGCEAKFKRITPKGVAILDEKSTLHNTALIPVNEFKDCDK